MFDDGRDKPGEVEFCSAVTHPGALRKQQQPAGPCLFKYFAWQYKRALLGGILLAADATWVNRLAWTFVGARGVHMLAYWFDVRMVRSAAFTIGLAATVGLVVAALAAG